MSYIGRTSLRRGIDRAITDFRQGKPVLIHDSDDREDETDLVYPADTITPQDVACLRNDAGGLICVAVSDRVAEAFELPFLADSIDHPSARDHKLDYDERSSFSIPVNHRSTRTGITDKDRARTIRELGNAAATPEQTDFAAEFRTPGHVPILRSSRGLLVERKGHTELGIALARKANRTPAVVVCEMLSDETGEAMTKAEAKVYAIEEGPSYIGGNRLVNGLP
jgi:3,4-dihydroxy 2-butanone 4-phosphate synthase